MRYTGMSTQEHGHIQGCLPRNTDIFRNTSCYRTYGKVKEQVNSCCKGLNRKENTEYTKYV